jgi:hypothetical protein
MSTLPTVYDNFNGFVVDMAAIKAAGTLSDVFINNYFLRSQPNLASSRRITLIKPAPILENR